MIRLRYALAAPWCQTVLRLHYATILASEKSLRGRHSHTLVLLPPSSHSSIETSVYLCSACMHTSITALYAAAALSGWGGVTVSHFRLQNNLAAKMTGCLFWILIHAIYYNKLNALQASAHSSHRWQFTKAHRRRSGCRPASQIRIGFASFYYGT